MNEMTMDTDTTEAPPSSDNSVVDNCLQVLRDEDNFISNVSQFYNEREISDVVIKVAEKSYFGHKFVLAKSSEVFKAMLYGETWSRGHETEIILTESPECQAVFDVFLKFMYTAEVIVTVDTAVGVLCLADKYNVTSLKALCVSYMVENTKSPNVHNALSWYNWAKALHLEELITSCTKTIAWNIETVLRSEEWTKMDLQFVSDILHNSGLVIVNEYILYTALLSWLLHETHLPDLSTNAQALLPLIRFPQMLVPQLYEIERSDFYAMPETKDLIKELVGRAYRFRSLCPSQDALEVFFDEAFYKPRNYMDMAVDSVRIQNTLRFGIQVDVRTYAGPVVATNKSGEWKITYRKHENNWTIQLYCHESATVKGEAFIETSVLILNEDNRVIQVDTTPASVCTRSQNLAINVNIEHVEESKSLILLIKPVAH